MRSRFLIGLCLLLFGVSAAASANQRASGFCTPGAGTVAVSNLSGTPQALVAYPGCTVTVYLSGTLTLATLYSDNLSSPTPLSNPFTADSVTGYWNFYAANGRYDVVISGGGLPSSFTYGDILLNDTASGSLIVGSFVTVPYSATPVFSAAAAAVQQITLSGNVTSSSVTNAVAGQYLTIEVCENSTGGYTFSWPSNFIFVPNLNLSANSCVSNTFLYDGADWYGVLSNVALKPISANGIQYAGDGGNDSQDGLSIGTLKLTLSAAQSALPASGPGIIIIPPSGITLTSTFSITRPNTTLECQKSALVNTDVSATSAPISVGASNVVVKGCSFTYTGGTQTSAINIPNTVSHVEITENTFSNYPGSNSNVIIGDRTNTTLAAAVTDISVHDNWFFNDLGAGLINVQDYAYRIRIYNNHIFTGTSSSNWPVINAQESDAGTQISALMIRGNYIYNAMGSDCVQVQQLTSVHLIINVQTSSNLCQLESTAGAGFSMAGINGLIYSNNTVDTDGLSYGGGNAAFESVNNVNSSETGNVAQMGAQAGTAEQQIYTVIADSGTEENVTFTGNSASVAYTGTGSMTCFYAATSVAASTVTRNDLTGNTCDFSGSTGNVAGIYLQVQNSSAVVSYNRIAQNVFIGANVTGDAGIVLENDAGTMANNVVGDNTVQNFHLPYAQNFSAQTAGLPAAALTTSHLWGIATNGLVSYGAQNVSGCSLTNALGGAWSGSFKSGTSGTCTVTITPPVTATSGFSCWSHDLTTVADSVQQTAYTSTTATLSGTTVSGDLIAWGCVAF